MTDDFEKYNIRSLVEERTTQGGYHVASSDELRVQFMNLRSGDTFGPVTLTGRVVLTCYLGACDVIVGETAEELQEMDQLVVSPGQTLKVSCVTETATVQFVWVPGFAQAASTP